MKEKKFEEILKEIGYSPLSNYYSYEVKKFLDFLKKKEEDITINDVLDYRDYLENSGYGIGTIKKKLYTIRAWARLNFEVNRKENFKKLYEDMKLMKMTLKRVKKSSGYQPIPVEHFYAILSSAKYFDPETKFFIIFYATTGVRAGAYGIKFKNIDFDNKMIKNLIVKGSKSIDIPITNNLYNSLLELIKYKYSNEIMTCSEEELIRIAKLHGEDFIFKHGKDGYNEKYSLDIQRRNRRNNSINAERLLAKICKKLGLWTCPTCGKNGIGNLKKCDFCNSKTVEKIYTPHQIRDSVAKYGGLSLEGLMDLLGHSSVETTKKFYARQRPEMLREELKKYDELISNLLK